MAIVLTCLGASYYPVGPLLLNDLRRHEPWVLAGLLVGDASAAFWFFQYYFVHFVLGRPLVSRPVNRRRVWRLTWEAVSLLLGLSVDFAVTLHALLWQSAFRDTASEDGFTKVDPRLTWPAAS